MTIPVGFVKTEIISASIGSGIRESALSKIIAILHDVGRFDQFLKYRTFSDHLSVNHAELAIQIIDENKILKSLSIADADIIKTAILSHSVKILPPTIDTFNKRFCNIIRDSDKLDILHIATSHYKILILRENPSNWVLTDNSIYSPEVCETVYSGRMVDYKSIRYLNDFKLAQIAWVYDLNFPCSFKLMYDRGYFQILSSELPQTDEVQRAVDKAEKVPDD